jgi:TolB-like protein/Flp pilus assembly protein TadD
VTIYAITAWVVLQVAEVTFEPLGFPAWMLRSLVVIAIIGLPISFILAWVIDFGAEGVRLDFPLWAGDTDKHRSHKKMNLVYTALFALLLASVTYSSIILLFDQLPIDKDLMEDVNAPPNSIAVLAFKNFDGHPESDFFASGLGEEILNILAGMRELSVAARTSSFRFRDDNVDIRDIARLLSVRHVLEGSVRQDAGRIRVTAQLINGGNGYHVWSAVYDRPLGGIFSIQQEIAAAVTNELQIALSLDSEQKLQQKPTENIDAYIYYLQGTERLRSSDDADVTSTAIILFQKAIEIDPVFSRAYAGICDAYLRLYEIGNDTVDFEYAQTACKQASELDSGLNSELYVSLGMLYRYRGEQWNEQAETYLNQAIAIDPTNVDAFIELGELRAVQNRMDDAEAFFLRAVDLKRNYWKAYEALAGFYYSNEQYQKAVDSYEIATSLAPDVASGFGGKGAAYTLLGEMDKARIAYDRSLELKPSRQAYTNIGLSYYYAGKFEDASDMQKKALEFAPDDHRVWGRLAESLRFIPGMENDSLSAYQKASTLAEDNLKINSSDWRTRGLLATYLAQSERSTEGIQHANRAVLESGRSSEALYYQSLARLIAGDQDGAIEAIEEAVSGDAQYRQFAMEDPDLAVLKGNERFDRLLSGVGE